MRRAPSRLDSPMRLLAILLVLGAASTSKADAPVGVAVPWAGIALAEPAGPPRPLAQWCQADWTVVVFLGTECPLARLYAPRLAQLADEYQPRGVQFRAVMSQQQDTADEVAQFARDWSLPFAALCDPRQQAADAFGAKRTPEVFVLDRDGVVRYHGRIDDQFTVGYQKPRIGRRDLAEALDELLAGQPVSQSELPVTGCVIARARPVDETAGVTYHGRVAGILDRHCAGCHRPGEIGPFSLTSYPETQGWGDTIREVVESGRMPPWFADPAHGAFSNDTRLNPADRKDLLAWIDAGCPEGAPTQGSAIDAAEELPPADDESETIVLKMSSKPFPVPAEGLVDYQTYTVDPGLKQDLWVSRVEVRPGNPSVVHHILVFVKPPKGLAIPLFPGELIGGYVPGLQNMRTRPGMAMRLPKGSQIVFQMHYTPNGTPTEDCSEIELTVAKPDQLTHEVRSQKAINILFQIPPRAGDYRAEATYMFARDAELLSMIPHMHLRGKSFEYQAVYPDGRREVLLSVPRWDFNWQLQYVLEEPKPMPRGTRLICTAHFDNSPQNPANPDPEQWVSFGEQTHEEMLIGFFMIAEPRSPRARRLTAGSPLAPARGMIAELSQPQPWTSRLLRVTDQAELWVRSAGQLGLLRDPSVAEEVPQVVRAALAEAEKQQILRGQGPAIDLKPLPAFLRRLRQGVRGLQAPQTQPSQ